MIYSLKLHLVGTLKHVGAYITILEGVKKLMLDVVYVVQQNFIKKQYLEKVYGIVAWVIQKMLEKKLRQEESEESSNIFKKNGTQTTINVIFKKS